MPAPLDAPMPQGLDVGSGYVVRVTALDPTTGNLVPGVNVNTVVRTAEQAGGIIGGGGGPSGEWFLVPGPGA